MTDDWSRLPAPLAECILQLAFQDSSRALPQWLCMSLVSRYDQARTAAIWTPQGNCSSYQFHHQSGRTTQQSIDARCRTGRLGALQ